MTKVVFLFAGTGDDGTYYTESKESDHFFKDDVLRIYIKGCQEEQVGNGFLFPDLEIAANNIRNAFEANHILNLDTLRQHFGDGLYAIYGNSKDESQIKIDDITLEGFSRGAVTTYATAKKLDDLNIPMHIIANQPVPGELGIAKGLYAQYGDLTKCRNIKSAYTFLASYDLEQGVIHNNFFRQMVARYRPEVNAHHILFPHQNHLDWFRDSPIGLHIDKIMSENALIETPVKFNYDNLIKKWYKKRKDTIYYTPYEFMQNPFGAREKLEKDSAYSALLMEDAAEFLAQHNIGNLDENLQLEQATAINAIASLSDEDIGIQSKKELCEFILQNSKNAIQLVKIINKVSEICSYLSHVTKDNSSNKSQLIKQHASEYQKIIFLNSYDFLLKDQRSSEDKKHFANAIRKAEHLFREKALGIERNILGTVFRFLSNFISHITGIGLIFNIVNKVKTGNWVLFKLNRSENVVRNTRKRFLDDLNASDAEQESSDRYNPKPKGP